MWDPERLRDQTQERLVQLGFPVVPPHLPILWEPTDGYSLRPIRDIIARTVVLNVAVAVSYGMPRDLARRWITDNVVGDALSPLEAAVVDGDEAVDLAEIQVQVEAIWAFAWVLSLGEELSPNALCPEDLVSRVPDLKKNESVARWKERTGVVRRSPDDVMSELDLHYCMTWGLAESNLKRLSPPGRIDQYAIWQRRRALEFSVAERAWTHDEWDDIDLST